MATAHSTAEAALLAVARRDLRYWQGLVPDTSLSDAAAVFRVDESWRATATLGQAKRPVTWVSATVEGYEKGLRVWLENQLVVLIDAPCPKLVTETETLLETLGPPDEKFDAYLGTFLVPESEWVYAGRGLTLWINPENYILLRLGVYVPTTIEAYRNQLRLDLEMRRLPLRHEQTEGGIP